MRKGLVALLALVPLTLGLQPASAGGNSSHIGNCEYTPGVLYAPIVVYSADPVENPVTARVTCSLWYPGSLVASFTATGTGFVTGAYPLTTVWVGNLTVCTDIDYLSTGDPSDHLCVADTESPVVGLMEPLFPTVNDVIATINALLLQVGRIPDPILCPRFGARAPGIPGVVDITPQGDVRVAGTLIWDCPPYGS